MTNRHPYRASIDRHQSQKRSQSEAPGKKSAPLTRLLDEMSQEMYGRERSRCIIEEQCVQCGHKLELHKLAQECVDEFRISGLCPGCWDDIWKEFD